eukprot:6280134-Amphidinium_carterae.1
MSYGTARYVGSKFLTKLSAFKAHTWHPELYRIKEAWAIVQRMGRHDSTRRLCDSVVSVLQSATSDGVSFWSSQLRWLQEMGTTWAPGGLVTVQGRCYLEFGMSTNQWKHGVRELMRIHSFLQATTMQRGLDRRGAFRLDLLVIGCIDIRVCPSSCEHCGEPDTAEHRLYSCQITERVRDEIKWGVPDIHRISEQGHGCCKFGLWSLPEGALYDASKGILGLLSDEYVRGLFGHVQNVS